MPPKARHLLLLAALLLGFAPALQAAQHQCAGYTATIVGTEADDVIVGTAGRDIIQGLDGNDVIRALSGDDVVCGGGGDDTINGGPGDDALHGEGGSDTASYAGAPGPVQVDLSLFAAAGSHGDDLLDAIENVVGSQWDDQLRGDDGPNLLNGRQGADALAGRGAADLLVGGPGRDTVTYADAAGPVWADLKSGDAGGDDGGDGFRMVEDVVGSRFDDYLAGNGRDNRIDGAGGDDVLLGRLGADELEGGTGFDVTSGGPGIDLCSGEAVQRCEPDNPGDSKNCGDFVTQRHAQAWHDAFVGYYGDVARLDADGNGLACESLP